MKRGNFFMVCRHFICCVVVVLFVTNFSSAQENFKLPSSFSEKSPGTAVALSLLGTAIPVGLTIALFATEIGQSDSVILGLLWLGSWLPGPAPGYFYGGLTGRGFLGMGIRAVGMGMFIAGGAISWNEGNALGDVLGIGGIAVVVGSMIYDLANVSGAVRNHNLKLRERELKISPAFIPQAKAFGVNIQFQF